VNRVRLVALAIVPGLIVAATSLVLRGAGTVDPFGSVGLYRAVMNAAALGRFFGLFVAVVLVWGWLRAAGASRWLLALAVVSGPLVYAVTAVAGVIGYFPVGEAFYYGLNPLTVAGIGAQCGFAGLAEVAWRWRSSRWESRVVTPGVIAAVVLGFGVLFFTVLFRGGVAYFFIYQRGYEVLFT
jgi:hypothetical protein